MSIVNDALESSSAGKVRHAATDVKDAIEETAKEVTRFAQEQGAKALDTASEYAKEGLNRAREVERVIEKRVSQRPLPAILLAVGLGFVAGMFLSRR